MQYREKKSGDLSERSKRSKYLRHRRDPSCLFVGLLLPLVVVKREDR